MHVTRSAIALVMLGLAAHTSGAQQSSSSKSSTKAPAMSKEQVAALDSAAKKLGVFAYPAKGQSAEKQKQDQAECYAWAKDQTGYDPRTAAAVNKDSVAKAAQQQSSEATKGTAVKGAAKGAAAGALIGAAAGDAGKGAAVGAAAGGVGGRAGKKKADKAAGAQAADAASSASNAQLDTFKKGYGTCLQGRGYTFNK